jgi:exosortase C (VPDSG-CTERM-specific)
MTRLSPQMKPFVVAAAVLVLSFSLPLWQLFRFAAGDDLHSYIVLMPFVCLYLIWLDKKDLPAEFRSAGKIAALLFASGAVFLSWRLLAKNLDFIDGLALLMLAFDFILAGLGCVFLGGAFMRAVAFPFSLLIFLVPFPEPMRNAIETFLQRDSAVLADWMFQISGLPVFRLDMHFQLPGMNLQVAPECSGIHSTIVLFITSLIAGQLLLQRPWQRAVLALFVIPLALVRNAFRIFVIGQLCVQVGPHMIDSPIHHQGGPLFFTLSLVPFFALLYWLRRSSKKSAAKIVPTTLP